MSTLGENSEINNVEELISILNMCNKAKEGLQISMLLEQMQEMEKNYTSVLQELTTVKAKLNSIQLNNLSQDVTKTAEKEVKNNVVQISDEASHDITEKYNNLQNIRENLNAGANQVIQKFKDVGITALNNVCEFLGIKEKLIHLRDDARSNEMKMKTSIEKIEKIESELGATILHAKNMSRAIAGKEALAETSGKKSKFFDMLKKPYLKHQVKYAKQFKKLNKSIEKFDSLEKAAGNIRNRDSVINKLSDNKKIVESQNTEKNDMRQEKTEMQRESNER